MSPRHVETVSTIKATHDAVVQYAREIARLPPLPSPVHAVSLGAEVILPNVLKLVTTDTIPGEVLPRSSDTWLAFKPFGDFTKNDSDAAKRDLIVKRRTFVSLLARLAISESPLFRWDAAKTNCGESSSPIDGAGSFWFDLQNSLNPTPQFGTKSKELTRQLIALSSEPSPRFLLCFTHELALTDFPHLLEQFLEETDALLDAEAVLSASGMQATAPRSITVEIGLSFSDRQITYAMLSKLLAILDRNSQRRQSRGVFFRVSTLHFGDDCTFQAKAFELLAQHPSQSAFENLGFGNLSDLKPAALRVGLPGILKEQRRSSRLKLTMPGHFAAIASALREGNSRTDELDIPFDTTNENVAWLAFGLFHIDSKSTVRTLRLRSPQKYGVLLLTSEQTEIFRRVLQTSTPDQELAHMERDEESLSEPNHERRFVTFHMDTVVKLDPCSSAKLLCKISDQNEEFEVIAGVKGWVAVVIPGYGVGWVRESSVISERPVTSRLTSIETKFPVNGKIKTLVWERPGIPPNQRQAYMELFLDLLAVVGEPLESLHLPAIVESPDQLAKILAYCPHLTELNISDHQLTSIAPLRDAYATGRCKIATLNIARWGYARFEDETTIEMAEILRGPGATTLRPLVVHLYPKCWGWDPMSPASQQAAQDIVRLAAESPTLEFVQLTESTILRHTNEDSRHARTPSVDFSARPFCFSSMPMRNKFAFLSCLKQSDTASAIGRLDACVISLIFRLSATSIRRRAIMNAIHE